MPFGRVTSIAALLCLVAAPAVGQVNYPHFSNTSGLTLNGSAATAANGLDPAPVLRLARSLVFDGGSAFTSEKVCLASFSSFFEFRITSQGGLPDASGEAGADGLTLTFQSAGPDALGQLGAGLGYSGIIPSVAVEFDTWDNGAIDAGTNHVGIDLNGDVNSVAKVAVPGRFDDGSLWSAWVDYSGGVLEVRVSNTGVRPAAPTLSLAIDLPGTLGSSAAFVGFTAATGAAFGDHDIVSWTLDGQCANVTIASCNTGVQDFVLPGDGLLSENIQACAIQATMHGGFVSCVAALTNNVHKGGFITGRQKGAIQSCAARAPYYTGPVKTAEFIVNGTFETGDTTGWILTTTGSGAWTVNGGAFDPRGPATPLPSIGGAFDLVSDQSGPQLNRAMQQISVPLDVRAATLGWSDRVQSYGPFLDPGQEFRVVIRNAFDLTPLVEVFSTSPGDPQLQVGPNVRSVDLTAALQALKGQTVVISFEQQAQTNFFTLTLDDVSLSMSYR